MLWTRLMTKSKLQPHQDISKMACVVQGPCRILHGRVYTRRYKSYQPPKVSGDYSIVLIRHGESEWNKLNLFCGWFNSELTVKGKTEAAVAGTALKEANYKFDMAYTSVLKRANVTLEIILRKLGQEKIPIVKSWRLNERHYGDLTGLNKAQVSEKYGQKQLTIWRRSYDIPPPLISPENPYYKVIIDDPIYQHGPPKSAFPRSESLENVINRYLPFWDERIVPDIKKGKSILIAAHVSTLRATVKILDRMTDKAIMKVHMPTAIPFKYTLDKSLQPVPNGSMQYLEDPEKVKKGLKESEERLKKK